MQMKERLGVATGSIFSLLAAGLIIAVVDLGQQKAAPDTTVTKARLAAGRVGDDAWHQESVPDFLLVPDPTATESNLTARAAFAALVERRNSPDGGTLKRMQFTDLEGNQVLVRIQGGTPPGCIPYWSPVQLYLEERKYECVYWYNPQVRRKSSLSAPLWCRGDFTWQDGKWVASPPRSAKYSIR